MRSTNELALPRFAFMFIKYKLKWHLVYFSKCRSRMCSQRYWHLHWVAGLHHTLFSLNTACPHGGCEQDPKGAQKTPLCPFTVNGKQVFPALLLWCEKGVVVWMTAHPLLIPLCLIYLCETPFPLLAGKNWSQLSLSKLSHLLEKQFFVIVDSIAAISQDNKSGFLKHYIDWLPLLRN